MRLRYLLTVAGVIVLAAIATPSASANPEEGSTIHMTVYNLDNPTGADIVVSGWPTAQHIADFLTGAYGALKFSATWSSNTWVVFVGAFPDPERWYLTCNSMTCRDRLDDQCDDHSGGSSCTSETYDSWMGFISGGCSCACSGGGPTHIEAASCWFYGT